MNIRRVRKVLIGAVAAHSLILGTAMLVRPTWTLGLAGWEYNGPSFFPAQSGIFLMILGGAYLAALWHRAFGWFLVVSKAAAVLFLVGEYLIGDTPDTVLLAALFDGLMGAAVAISMTWREGNRCGSVDAAGQPAE